MRTCFFYSSLTARTQPSSECLLHKPCVLSRMQTKCPVCRISRQGTQVSILELSGEVEGKSTITALKILFWLVSMEKMGSCLMAPVHVLYLYWYDNSSTCSWWQPNIQMFSALCVAHMLGLLWLLPYSFTVWDQERRWEGRLVRWAGSEFWGQKAEGLWFLFEAWVVVRWCAGTQDIFLRTLSAWIWP